MEKSTDLASAIARIKRERELKEKPFPLWALLAIYENSRHTLYVEYFHGFKTLIEYLSPIDIPQAPKELRIPILHRSYEIQELAKHLRTSQENIYYGYQTTISKLLK